MLSCIPPGYMLTKRKLTCILLVQYTYKTAYAILQFEVIQN